MTRLRNIIALLREQLWILPALITAAAAVLAYVLLRYGTQLLNGAEIDSWWLYSGDASTARGLLSSLLSGLITMTSLIVSVTFVILTLAANQLGPRLISIFMADRQIQAVIGLFLGTILYTIIVFRTLDDTLGAEGVPHVAITVASILTVLCLFALLFYIHKIAQSIIADNVVKAVADGLRHNLRNILSDDRKRENVDAAWETITARLGRSRSDAISLDCCGYIQVIDYNRLIDIACDEDVLLEIKVRAGHFVLKEGDHVIVHAGGLGEKARSAIRGAFIIGGDRTPAQDMEHGIRQLVEIALRALSPGINDPFTAITVIDRLGSAFEEIFVRPLQPKVLRDQAGAVRVIADRSDASGLVNAAFNGIRQAGAGHPAVLIRIADALGQLAPVLKDQTARSAVLEQIGKLAETARHADLPLADLEDTLRRADQAAAAIAARWETG